MNDKNKQVKEIYKLPDGEIVVPFEGADNLQPQDNPYKINPYNPITFFCFNQLSNVSVFLQLEGVVGFK